MITIFFCFFKFAAPLLFEDAYKYWNNYKINYNLKFNPKDEYFRFSVFTKNYVLVETHNNQNYSYKLKLNKFAHLVNKKIY